ncbi:hypothetical protein LY90DRAFT_504902 [Neocallimastix californiae]|uniref:Phosphatidylethanolamine N-methyltransferase n=1 Tax=Neocallimastix californiae TaxID=1754190 RepID=A0A1Y2E2J4_9FUNG|nr:hypothetical protein LY90DRAFT_504902 [Neocallimastix californiae]|eukprot:ORY65752.1 hypothetical protein LY90DRAFT_504902 [Neocallimastix californiae]
MEKTSKNENTTKGEEKESFFEKLFKPRPNLEYELYKQKKTIGRTLNTNIEFEVPYTTDVMNHLFDITKIFSHSIFEYATLFVFFIQIFLFFFTNTSGTFFLVTSLIWRFLYDAGIGYLLKIQSDRNGVVKFMKKHIFNHVKGKGHEHEEKFIVRLIRQQFNKKMADDYDFDAVPVEYNCWILFRCIEDLILVNDFTSYCCFSFRYLEIPNPLAFTDILRYIGAALLILLNIWVKHDAHRVVKDFAWYWGDFFFLVDSNLTFDGVFEIVPHPMYSVGYIGYYGSALMTKSYLVLFISLLIHAAQLAFLVFVENPHIQKIYGSSNPKRPSGIELEKLRKYFNKDAIGFFRLDLYKSSDILSLVVSIITIIYTFSIDRSSNMPIIIYNFLTCITFVSFIAYAIRNYTLPDQWTYGTVLLRHTVGFLLIILHIYTATEVYEVLGDYGWFYGDFFIKELISPERLYYSGIYRSLTIQKNSWVKPLSMKEDGVESGIIKEVSKIMNRDARIKSIYDNVQRDIKEIGLKRVISNKSLKTAVNKWANSLNDPETVSQTTDEDDSDGVVLVASSRNSSAPNLRRRGSFSNSATKLFEKTKEVVDDTAEIHDNANSKNSDSQDSLPSIDNYKNEVHHVLKSNLIDDKANEIEGQVFELGSPIRFNGQHQRSCKGRWLYALTGKGKSNEEDKKESWTEEERVQVIENSKFVTEVKKNNKGVEIVRGELVFENNLIPWELGSYEVRYHFKDGYNVLCVSQPFEIIVIIFNVY